MKQNLQNFLEQVTFENKDSLELWQQIKNLPSFENLAKQPACCIDFKNHADLPFYKTKGTNKVSYLPLEFMKAKQESWLTTAKHKTFLSSGTSGGTRSQSHFSHDGLLLYKLASLKTFADLLKRFFPEQEIMSLKGISLIPTTSTWPDSSLAQMIAWFAEFWDVNYITDNKQLKIDAQEPIWLFATAVQLMDLYEQGFRCQLPKSSLIIETGGTKTRKKVFTKQELYTALEETFAIEPKQIISEYSMCELASQAYDFANKGSHRRFHFPSWVDLSTLHPLSLEKSSGFGSLVIKDPLRIDYPFPMRTQDLCELAKNKTFTLHGRVPSAALKGCSLKAEELLEDKKANTSYVKRKKERYQKPRLDLDLILRVKKFLESFFAKAHIGKKLDQECSSAFLGQESVQDLLQCFPIDLDSWENIIEASQAKSGDHCFLILPNNHPFVLFYPFVVGFFAGLKFSIRLPRAYHQGSILHEFLENFTKIFGYDVEILDPEFRFSKDLILTANQKVLAYGSEETEALFAKEVQAPQNFFGGGVSLTVIDDLKNETLTSALKDGFSLGQKGCFSSRVVFCLDQELKVEENFQRKLTRLCNTNLKVSLPADLSIALDQELLHLKQKPYDESSLRKNNSPLFPIYEINRGNILELTELVSPCAFVLPFVFCSTQTFLNLLKPNLSFIKISLSDDLNARIWSAHELKKIELCSLGKLNQTVWDGTHQNKPLFSFTNKQQ